MSKNNNQWYLFGIIITVNLTPESRTIKQRKETKNETQKTQLVP